MVLNVMLVEMLTNDDLTASIACGTAENETDCCVGWDEVAARIDAAVPIIRAKHAIPLIVNRGRRPSKVALQPNTRPTEYSRILVIPLRVTINTQAQILQTCWFLPQIRLTGSSKEQDSVSICIAVSERDIWASFL